MSPKQLAKSASKRTASGEKKIGRKQQRTVTSDQYQYSPIHGDQIRIFILMPQASDDTCRLEGHLTVEQRNEPKYDENGDLIRGTGSYEALSYTWGSDEKPFTVFVDGRTLDIGRNLHEALHQMRLRDQPRRLWIDAFCIDQSNAVEKTGQVKAMWQIYGDATMVFVWLGEDSALEDGRKTFEFSTWAVAQQPRWNAMQETGQHQTFPRIMDCFNAEASTSSFSIRLDHVQMFLSRPWFSRLWVVQEFRLAVDIIVQCGRHTTGLKSIEWLLHYSLWHAPRPVLTVRDNDDYDDSRVPSYGKCRRLLSMVNMSADFGYECKDARDRVGALISVGNINRNDFHPFSVNYSDSVELNYIRFAEYMLGCLINNGSQVALLGMAATRHPLGLIRNDGMPSWVPDWRETPSYENNQLGSGSVNVIVLLAVAYEVQSLTHNIIRLRLVVSHDPNTTIEQIESMFERKARDCWGNGCWKFNYIHIKHGDIICYFAQSGGSGDLDPATLALRKSQTHKDSWVIIGTGNVANVDVDEDDECLQQLRQNFNRFKHGQTTIDLTIV